MFSLPIIIPTLLAIPFLFPKEFVPLARKTRHFLRNDLRKRLTDKEWNAIRHEFDDL